MYTTNRKKDLVENELQAEPLENLEKKRFENLTDNIAY